LQRALHGARAQRRGASALYQPTFGQPLIRYRSTERSGAELLGLCRVSPSGSGPRSAERIQG
jgi:hypothetical protein